MTQKVYSGNVDEVIGQLARELAETRNELAELKTTVTAQGTVLRFLSHVCMVKGVESPSVWNNLIESIAAGIDQSDGPEEQRNAARLIATAMRAFTVQDDG